MNGEKEVSGSRPGEDGKGNKDDLFDKDVSQYEIIKNEQPEYVQL